MMMPENERPWSPDAEDYIPWDPDNQTGGGEGNYSDDEEEA
jgi:hypothetical protein